MNNKYVRLFSLFFVLFLIYQAPEQASQAAEGFGAFALRFIQGLGTFLEGLFAGASAGSEDIQESFGFGPLAWLAQGISPVSS